MEQHLSDLQKADEATVLLAHKHDLNQVEIKGETTTLRELAAKLDVDHDVLQSLRNQPDEDGFEDWLDVLVLPWSLSVILASTGKK